MSEFDSIVQIIRQSSDEFLLDRLSRNPDALRLSFWESHFEHLALMDYPCIGGHVLDFGCGTGHADIWLARRGVSVSGVDINRTAIKVARFLAGSEPYEVSRRLRFYHLDELVPDCRFDSVWSSNVFEHIPDPTESIKSISSVCRRGAYILVSVPQGYHYQDPDHVHHFMTKGDLVHHFAGLITPLCVEHDAHNHMLRLLGSINE